MDTNELLVEPSELHIELSKAAEKLDKRDARAQANVGFGATTAGMAITRRYIGKIIEAVQLKLGPNRAKVAGSIEFQMERVLRQLPPEVIALSILQHGLHCVALVASHRKVVLTLGNALASECWAAKLTSTDKKLAEKISRAVKERHGSIKHRQAAAKAAAHHAGFMMKAWSQSQLAHAGQWAMNILLNALPEVFMLTEPSDWAVSRGGRDFAQLRGDKDPGQRQLVITPGGMDMAEEAIAEAVVSSPVYQPRTERPKDWDSFYAHIAEDQRTAADVPLLRTWHKDIVSGAKHAIKTGTMAPALKGVNVLQSVPFRLNTWIMDIIQQCYARGIKIEGLPSKHGLDVPERLPDVEFSKLTVDERKLISKTINGIKAANRATDCDRVQFKEDMETASRFSLADHFFVPMNMDWRGRVYGLSHFNFSREDRVRSMFLFANGEPIGEEGIYWLKIHVANCGDFDKVSKKPMEDRIAWVNANLTAIASYAQDPLLDTGWTTADSPFLFLAACRELTSALAVGVAYVSHMPVSFDGSCSGLQHLAAMTRAPEGRHVNLTNNAIPADVYQLVADLTKQRIEDDLNLNVEEGASKDIETADRDRRYARLCLDFGVTRSLVKRNVMTFAYSSKEFGMSQQHVEDTMEPLKLKVLKKELEYHPFGEDEGYGAAKYLAKRVLASIKSVVERPAEAMGFLQQLARALAHEGKPLKWTSPAGIPWVNRYHDSNVERLELWLHDKGVKVRTRVTVATSYQPEMAKEKCSAGVSPNFVHANDAAHLLLTVGAAADEGITDIATVHDSFGCLPSRAGRFNQIIREQFLKMYEDHDVLAEIRASAQADLTEANHHKLPALPEKGALDLKEILNARYAFA